MCEPMLYTRHNLTKHRNKANKMKALQIQNLKSGSKITNWLSSSVKQDYEVKEIMGLSGVLLKDMSKLKGDTVSDYEIKEGKLIQTTKIIEKDEVIFYSLETLLQESVKPTILSLL